MDKTKVVTGLERLKGEGFNRLKGLRLALLSNQSAVDSEFVLLKDQLAQNPAINLTKLLAPEHGFDGVHQDMDAVESSLDASTGLPIFSLYQRSSVSLSPAESLFADVDALLVDLPDIGSRYYTFAQSMVYCMQTAKTTGTKVIVLDRPNPIGGQQFEGTELLPSCRSFCGYASVPQRHGLTLGELAELANRGFGREGQAVPAIGCDLEVVKVQHWQRELWHDQCSHPWVMPSVNMPTLDTASVYPGSCLFEATNISEGRGTTRPFELLGAPYINSETWIAQTFNLGIPLEGVILRPASFMPKFQKHQNTLCQGLQIHVVDRQKFQPFLLGVALLYAARELYPDHFKWRDEAYEFVRDVPAIDLLYGSSALRETVSRGDGLRSIAETIADFSSWYGEARKEFLLY